MSWIVNSKRVAWYRSMELTVFYMKFMVWKWKYIRSLGSDRWIQISRIISLFLIIAFLQCVPAHAAPEIWKVLLAEAASEGYDGMYAVACVIRNRGGDLRGFCGAKRKDLDGFCERQGRKYIDMAKDIERRVFTENAPDSTDGATHFENIEKYGVPYWAKGMTVTAKIGFHTFFRKS